MYGCFQEYPQIMNLNRVFHCKPSILGAHPYFWKHPYSWWLSESKTGWWRSRLFFLANPQSRCNTPFKREIFEDTNLDQFTRNMKPKQPKSPMFSHCKSDKSQQISQKILCFLEFETHSWDGDIAPYHINIDSLDGSVGCINHVRHYPTRFTCDIYIYINIDILDSASFMETYNSWYTACGKAEKLKKGSIAWNTLNFWVFMSNFRAVLTEMKSLEA